jgi:DNA-directed RNA polymerase subunit beta'
LVDTALRTANAGYLTRRLIDVLQDVVILQIDCGPLGTEGCFITDFKDETGNILVSLRKRLLGRVTAEPLKIGKTTIIRNTEIK